MAVNSDEESNRIDSVESTWATSAGTEQTISVGISSSDRATRQEHRYFCSPFSLKSKKLLGLAMPVIIYIANALMSFTYISSDYRNIALEQREYQNHTITASNASASTASGPLKPATEANTTQKQTTALETPTCFVANMLSAKDLVDLSTTLPRPVINLGFPKSGTTTMFAFFSCGGWRSSHYRCPGNGTCGQCMRRAVARDLPPLKSCGNFEAYLELEVTFPPKYCYWPQIQALEEIHRESPNATFILSMRDVGHWINSVAHWHQLSQRLAQCNLTEANSTQAVKDFFCSHVERIRTFVSDHPSHTLVAIGVESPDAGAVMSRLFDISELCWGHENKNKKLHSDRR